MKHSFWIFALLVFVFTSCDGGQDYKLTEDSLPQEGVPKGKLTKHVWDTSEIYPGTTRDYWVYVPVQYESSKPACVMIFQDGEVFIDEEGPVNIPVVFDNLIYKQEMPVTIAILINPGTKDGKSQRRLEYGIVSDTYARFLLEEIIPEVGKTYNLTDDRKGRAISGASAGGICSYIVGWERNDAFSKVVSFIGGFVGVPGAGEYPSKARITRGDPKPLRVYLQTGENDLSFMLGDVKLGNMDMANALEFAGYDYRFEMGTGGHDLKHGGANLPNTLRWLWRDYPGVKGYEEAKKEKVDYELSGDSIPQEGVPKGKITEYSWNQSKIYPGSTRDYWIYVPAQYNPDIPACLMVFFDGEWFKDRVSTVFDNLIHKKAMPVTIGLFINPGIIDQPEFNVTKSAGSAPTIAGKTFTTKDGDYETTWIFTENGKVQVEDRGGKGYSGTYEQKGQWVHIKAGDEFWAKYDGEKFEILGTKDNRGIEYDTVDDRNARFIVEEILPEVTKKYNITKDPAGRAISGFSSGGSGAFNVAWQMPDQFSKVLSFCASYTNCRGGNAYPTMVRKTRGNPKPIRLFVVGADDDLNIREGNWTIGNLKMASALKFARYDYRFEMGSGGHEMHFGFSILPETLRWLWRDYPGVKSEGVVNSSPETISGEWDIETIVWDEKLTNVLTLTTNNGILSATFKDQENNQYAISNVIFKEDILSFDLVIPELGEQPLAAWGRVVGDKFDGVLGADDEGMVIDYPMKGKRK